jgi:hypothetical protein
VLCVFGRLHGVGARARRGHGGFSGPVRWLGFGQMSLSHGRIVSSNFIDNGSFGWVRYGLVRFMGVSFRRLNSIPLGYGYISSVSYIRSGYLGFRRMSLGVLSTGRHASLTTWCHIIQRRTGDIDAGRRSLSSRHIGIWSSGNRRFHSIAGTSTGFRAD